jgi:hypothetical protein
MRRRVFPRHPGFYDTVFSQPVFWVLVVAVFLGLGALSELGWI